MKKSYLLFLLFLIFSATTFSQSKKFSVEVNYPFGFSNGIQRFTGIADANVKFRFLQTELLNYGVGYTFTYARSNFKGYYDDLNRNYFFHHLDGLVELNIASVPKLHPYLALGFTYAAIDYEYYYTYEYFGTIKKAKESDPGFNFKLGAQYDLSSSFFLQANFHYIQTYNKIGDDRYSTNFNQFKLGAGFRF